MRKLLWLVLPGLLLLAGCFSVETTYEVNEDGSGSQTIRFAVPMELMQALGSDIPSLEELQDDPEMDAVHAALGDRGSLTFFSDEDEGFGFEMVVHVPASEDFTAALQEALADLPEDLDLPISEVTSTTAAPLIRRDGDRWTFSQEMEPLSDDDLGDIAGDPQAAAFASTFLQDTSVTVRLRLPGQVVSQNADEVLSDGTLVWTQQGIEAGRTLSATSELGGSSGVNRVLLITLGVVGAAVLVSVLAYLAMRRSPTEA